jgi:nucleoside-diphosphate-sugar epimerase
MPAPPRILITGASGFLGCRLAQMVLAGGEPIRLLLRPGSRLGLAPDPERIETVRCAFDDEAGLARAMAGIRIVHNCAGLSSDWGTWAAFRAANVDNIGHLLEAARRAGTVDRFVHVSTTDVYGYPKTPGDESDALRDVGLPYNRSKGMGDALTLSFCRETGLPVTVIRPATIFGPGSKDWVIEVSELLAAGWLMTIERGAIPAGLVYVDDVAQAMIALAGNPAASGEAYNIVDPHGLTWREYFDRLADGLGLARPRLDLGERTAHGLGLLCEAVYRALGISSRPLFTRHVVRLLSRSQHYDMRKVSAAVSGFPAIGVEEGMARTLAWLKARQS